MAVELPPAGPNELAAEAWHSENCREEPARGSCWCCCFKCEDGDQFGNFNPYYQAAMNEIHGEDNGPT